MCKAELGNLREMMAELRKVRRETAREGTAEDGFLRTSSKSKNTRRDPILARGVWSCLRSTCVDTFRLKLLGS